MSELSAAAAAALGIPEAIVERSAAARAEETGMTVDEVLAAWAGGGDIPPPAAAAPAPAEPEAAEEPAAPVSSPEGGGVAAGDGGGLPAPPTGGETPPSPPAAVLPPPGGEIPSSPPPAVLPPAGGEMPAPSGKPPVLVGEADNPIAVLVGAVGLFVALFLVGVVGPALPTENPGARTSDLPYTQAALHGQEIYQSVGCASCHTQMVRPVVADVGLGAVSLNDTNQVLGTRRFGPDLSNVGRGSRPVRSRRSFSGSTTIPLCRCHRTTSMHSWHIWSSRQRSRKRHPVSRPTRSRRPKRTPPPKRPQRHE